MESFSSRNKNENFKTAPTAAGKGLMGISSGDWAGLCVNLQIVQIPCENLVMAAGAQHMGGGAG